jgi:hypothetical protein
MSRNVAGKLDELADLLRGLPPERVALLLRPSERLTVYLTPVQKDAIRRAAEHYDLTLSGFAVRVLDAVAAIVVQHREGRPMPDDD